MARRPPRRKRRTGPAAAGRALEAGIALGHGMQIFAELALASAQTIAHRSAMLGRALGDPVAMADPEFTLMAREKLEAAAASGVAMAEEIGAVQRRSAVLWWGQMQRSASTMLALAACPTPAAAARILARAAEAAVSDGLHAGLDIARAAERMNRAAVAPIHRAATANARRLARAQGWQGGRT